MKPAWALVKLRVAFGEVPAAGNVLRMRSGRRYQVIKVAGRTLHALVLPLEHRTGRAKVIPWCWAPRRGRR